MNQNAHKNLKIVMSVSNNVYPADPRVRNEAETLAAAGHEVTVIVPQGESQKRREQINNVRVIRYPTPPEGSGMIGYAIELIYVTLVTSLTVLYVLLRHGIDVLHVHNPPDILFIVGLIPKLLGKKLVWDHHDLAAELYQAKFGMKKGFVYRILLLMEYLSSKMADRVIVVNQSYAQNNIERNGIHPENITIVRNGPSITLLDEVEPDKDIRKRAKFIGGYLGHIAKQDGVDHLIKALYHVQTDHKFDDWHVFIIGPSDDFTPLKKLAAELGVADKITFTGYQPDEVWRKILASTDVCFVPDPANPLNEKSTMTKMMDYMALGKPVIAYDLIENRVSGGNAALYAKPSDPADFASQFMHLVKDESLRQQLSRCGKQRIKDQLAWEYSAKSLQNLYDSDFTYHTAESRAS